MQRLLDQLAHSNLQLQAATEAKSRFFASTSHGIPISFCISSLFPPFFVLSFFFAIIRIEDPNAWYHCDVRAIADATQVTA